MRIQHNIAALNTHRNLAANNTSAGKDLEKLSSGYKINRAGDDAAGLSISEKMRGQIRGLDMATKNAQDSISLIQTAEGGLNETHSILQRMRELAVQSANDTNVAADRTAIQAEIDELASEITRIAENTEFNTQSLLNGGAMATGITFHIGANKDQAITLKIDAMDATSLTVNAIDVTSQTAANGSIETINDALSTVSTQRSKLGAVQNRLEHTISNLGATSENLTAAESRIRDTDMAK